MYYNFSSPQCVNDLKSLICCVKQLCEPFSSFIILSYNCGYGTNLIKEECCKMSESPGFIYQFLADWLFHNESEDTVSSPINIWYKSEADDIPFFLSSSAILDEDLVARKIGSGFVLGWLVGQILNASDIYFYKKHNLKINYGKDKKFIE